VRRTVRQADRVVQFGDGDGRVDERLDDEVPVVFTDRVEKQGQSVGGTHVRLEPEDLLCDDRATPGQPESAVDFLDELLLVEPLRVAVARRS